MLEFALALPVVLPIGLYGIELANYSMVQLKLSQTAMALADNASRVGVDTGLATQQIREVDVNDILQGARLQSGGIDLTTNGRVILSSLETTGTIPRQYLHWQRCVGLKSGSTFDSSYGEEGDGANWWDFFQGMGESGEPVTAPVGSAVMFVEINYQYQPLISKYFLGEPHLHVVSSFIVRDNRDLGAGLTNPNPSVPASKKSTCDRYST